MDAEKECKYMKTERIPSALQLNVPAASTSAAAVSSGTPLELGTPPRFSQPVPGSRRQKNRRKGQSSSSFRQGSTLRRRFATLLQRGLIYGAALVVAGFLFYLIAFIFVNGFPALRADLFSLVYTSENVSMLPALVNTGSMILLTLVIALPLGVLGAVYLTEYTRPKSRAASLIAAAAEVLSSVPSIVFGLFGSLFFVRFLELGMSLISGALTMALIVLPLILRTSQQALSEVPQSLREGSLALGAGHLHTIFKVVLPAAFPGILSGTILAIGRITGESAALIFTAGTAVTLVTGLDQSARTLAVHMYSLASEGLHIPQTWATALILLVAVLCLNALSALIRRFMERQQHG